MAGVAFFKGQELGPKDLDIYMESSGGVPKDVAEISYALYDFTTGAEVLLGSPKRIPEHPSVGHYYAYLVVPLDANLGSYRIRWTFKEVIGGPVHQAVQEWAVIDQAAPSILSVCTPLEADLVRSLRIMLRDNCIGEEEVLELDVSGERVLVTIKDLWEAIHANP